jgi:UPF0755 protein
MRRFGCLGMALPLLLALVGLGWFAGGWWVSSKLEKDIEFSVPEGATLTSAAKLLEEAHAIGSPFSFLLRAKVLGSGDGIQAGEFLLPAGTSEAGILNILQHGKPLRRLITIPEGMPSIMVWERLNAENLLTGTIPVPAEGTLLPDSYDFQRGEARSEVVKRMQAAMREYLITAWGKRGPSSVVKTPEQAVILASVVEKETGKASERPMVAGVMSNRLRIGMALGADATAIYPITKGKPLGRMIRVSELRDPNPYNTRAIRGLPVGPITNPGREAIAAVLNPAKTDALYYVADGTGGHVFANTLAEHNANVAKWRAIRRQRGEM